MAYQNDSDEQQNTTDTLCLYGPLAKDFMRTPINETVQLTITATLRKAAMESSSSEDEYPVAEFEVLDVEGGRKEYQDMSSSEMEKEIYNVKNEDQPEPPQRSNVPNREDGGSIWLDMKRQEKLGRQPTRRPKPFRMG